MKYSLFPVAVLFLIISACGGSKSSQAYDPGCDKLIVDVNAGTINGMSGKAKQKKVKVQFPCSTGSTEDGSDLNCGGGVFFNDHNFYFYTGQDYIEVRFPFDGEVKPRIISLSKDRIETNFGKPVRSEQDGALEYLFFKKDYGTLVITFQSGKAKNFAMHQKEPEEVQLCL